MPRERCHLSCLCIDNARYRPAPIAPEKSYDFLFCGRLESGKHPGFAIDVAARCALALGRRTRLLVVGAGSLEAELRRQAIAVNDQVDTCFHGFASQAELPSLYQSARVFLFPTLADVWGVVANEACAAGLPVIVSPHAGVADELVTDGYNGFVRSLDLAFWAEAATRLLTDHTLRLAYGQRSLLKVAPYAFTQAAQGIIDACKAALTDGRKRSHGLALSLHRRRSRANDRHQRPMV